MNRHTRRKIEAEERREQARADRMPPARADGRPQFYDISNAERRHCYYCETAGLFVKYTTGQAVMNDPANPPKGLPKGEMHTICIAHLPDNAVIYNPRTNLCRNKAGDETWEEGSREPIHPLLG